MDTINQNRVLVTGAGGALGTILISKLVQSGFYVRAIVWPKLPENTINGVDYCIADIRDLGALESSFYGIDVILHMAALILTRNEDDLKTVNIQGTKNIVELAQVNNISRFIYISSISVIYKKLTPYAQTKLVAEQLVINSKLNWTIIRPTLLVGKDGGAEYKIFERLSKKHFVVLPNNGVALKRPLHITDLAETLNKLVTQYADTKFYQKIYALAGLQSYSLKEMLCEMKGQNIKIISIPIWIAKLAALILKIIPTRFLKFDPEQAMVGLIEDANPTIQEAIEDLKYSPDPLFNRWHR